MKKVFVWAVAVLAAGMFQFAGIMPVAADNSEVVIASDQKPADAAAPAPAAPAEEVKEEAPAPVQGEEVQPPPAEEEPAPEEGQEVKDSGSQG
jgi:hypothetical protein